MWRANTCPSWLLGPLASQAWDGTGQARGSLGAWVLGSGSQAAPLFPLAAGRSPPPMSQEGPGGRAQRGSRTVGEPAFGAVPSPLPAQCGCDTGRGAGGDASALVFPLGCSRSVATRPRLAGVPLCPVSGGTSGPRGAPGALCCDRRKRRMCLGPASGASAGASVDFGGPWGRNMRRALGGWRWNVAPPPESREPPPGPLQSPRLSGVCTVAPGGTQAPPSERLGRACMWEVEAAPALLTPPHRRPLVPWPPSGQGHPLPGAGLWLAGGGGVRV